MKPVLILFLFFAGMQKSSAQDSVTLLSPNLFDREQLIFLSTLNGWIFHEGHDPSWSRSDLNTQDWNKVQPGALSPEYVNKDGRVEGWFRFRFRLDRSFDSMQLFLKQGVWAATDVYLDGTFL